MNKIKVYIPSLILSILFVFSMIGLSGIVVIKNVFNSDKFISLTEKYEIVPAIKDELEKYFSSEYNETGIPAEVYTDYLTDEYLAKVEKIGIKAGFNRLSGDSFDNTTGTENANLEDSIENFFSDYADSINYTKDSNYEEKLQETIDSAYSVIIDYCDVFRFNTMESENLLAKASGIYTSIDAILIVLAMAAIILLFIIIVLNIKSLFNSLYWLGVSAIISGIIGAVPTIYCIASKAFDAFTIKQSQIFAAFTGVMYHSAKMFLILESAYLLAGIVLLIIFGIIRKKKI